MVKRLLHLVLKTTRDRKGLKIRGYFKGQQAGLEAGDIVVGGGKAEAEDDQSNKGGG